MNLFGGMCGRWLVVAVTLLAACDKSDDNNVPYSGPPLGDAPADLAPSAVVDGTSPMDDAILGVVAAWDEDVTVENAAAHEAALRSSMTALVTAGAQAADRLAASCGALSPVEDTANVVTCHNLLRSVESAASTTLLSTHASMAVTPWPEGSHPMSVRPEVTVRQSAIETLAVHARAGSTLATEALTQLAQATDESVRAAASRAIMGSLSRREAKRILRDVLAPDEQWRMYEVRP